MNTDIIDHNTLLANYEDVEMLRRCIIDLKLCEEAGPNSLFVVLHRDAWMERQDPVTGEIMRLKPTEFRRFITDRPRKGLGQDLDEMKDRFCGGDLALLELWDKATVGKRGSEGKTNNQEGRNQYTPERDTEDHEVNTNNVSVNHKPTHGNDPQYALRRLRSQAPELHARVLAGDLSPHRAMIEAGFRDRTIAVPLVPEKAARILRKHFSADQLELIFTIALQGDEAVR